MAILKKKSDKVAETTPAADAKASAPVKLKENTGDAYKILLKNLVTEKTFRGQGQGKVTFKVDTSANKISVRNAIEKVYDVKVLRVNIVNVHGKVRKFGGRYGKTSSWKKAIVTLKPGQSIGGTNIEGSQV